MHFAFISCRDVEVDGCATTTTTIRFKMGIIYYVAFRFGAVKDIAKIDEEIDYYGDDYVETARKNLNSFSSPLRFGGEMKGVLFIYDIQIPEHADVICISNSACDNYEYHTYDMVFENGDTCKKVAYHSDNRFMIPANGHSSFSYRVGPGGFRHSSIRYDGKKNMDQVTPAQVIMKRM